MSQPLLLRPIFKPGHTLVQSLYPDERQRSQVPDVNGCLRPHTEEAMEVLGHGPDSNNSFFGTSAGNDNTGSNNSFFEPGGGPEEGVELSRSVGAPGAASEERVVVA